MSTFTRNYSVSDLPPAVLTALLALGPLASPAWALSIVGYDPAANNRFSSNFLSTPLANTSVSYIGAGYDLSGAGWVSGTGATGDLRMQNTTLLTPLHTIIPTHYTPANGTQYSFLNTDNALYTNTLSKSGTITTPGYSNDITVGTLTKAVDTAQKVTPYRVLDVRGGSLSGQSLIIYGSNADGQGARLGRATGSAVGSEVQTWSSSGATGSAVAWESGDSGSPAFVKYTAPDNTTSLTFAGAAWFANGLSTLQVNSLGTYNPASAINSLTKLDGYAIKWVIYDNAANTATTAPQWTGSSSADPATAANWSQSINPANNSVLFDASAAGAVTTLTLDSALSLRGALFKASASSAGFVINGAGTLTLGSTGLRNESTATQTFNVPIALSDSQNWEAANGNLVFNGGIDTTAGAHLVVVGGNHNTILNGVLTGSGALAKDDSGTLILNAANTYTGKTWIHDGTLRVGTGSLPAGTEVIFQTTNPATLDLNGHNQTIAGLKSVYGGTGQVQLGGGTLTVNNSSTNLYAGTVDGAGGLIKNGTGLLALSGTNNYSGATIINAGYLRVASSTALSANTNVVLNTGGILELGAGDYQATLGTGAGQISFSGSGGFSAYGGNRSVTLNQGATLTWGDANFISGNNTLIFSSPVADATVDFRNNLVLGTTGSGMRNIVASYSLAGVDARMSGNISDGGGTFGINKYNSGTLELTGNNTYKGSTTINGGVIRISSSGALSSASNVALNGGVLELGFADYNASLGSGAGQVRFLAANGGFSAAGANRSVNLGGAATPLTLTWGATNFVADGKTLVLSTTGADATLDFRNPLVLGTTGSGTRTVQVDNGTAAVDARLSGNLTETNGASYALTKTGAGTLELTGANTYSGATTVTAGVLRIGATGALSAGSNLNLAGGILELGAGDYSASLGTGAGQIQLIGSAGFSAAGSDRTVNIGGSATPSTLTWGATSFIPAGSTLLLSSAGSDATLNFANSIILGTSGSGTRIVQVDNGTAAVDARLTGKLSQSAGTFGLNKTGAGTLELTGVNTYTGATTISGGTLRVSALPTANIVLAGGVLELSGGNYAATLGTGAGQISFSGNGGFSAAGANRSVTLNGGASLVWGSSAGIPMVNLILSSDGADATIDFRNPLALGNRGPVTRTVQVNNGTAAIDARLSGVISQTTGTHGLAKTGAGTLELTGTNTYLGTTFVNAGTLLINGNQSASTGDVMVASGATLGGNGRIGGSTTIQSGGSLALGTHAQALVFNRNLSFEPGAALHILIENGGASSIAGTGYDRLTVTGSTALNGATLDLDLGTGFASSAQTGVVFTFLSTSALLGTFAQGNSMTATVDGINYLFSINYGATDLKLILANISAVPEPAAYATVLGILALGACSFRVRSKGKGGPKCNPACGA